jgi:peptidoglycan hydrolase-like protein with peptidoglycan-binding domain
VAVAGAVVVVAGVSTAAALGVFGGDGTDTPAASNLPPATAEVTVATLVATEEFDGSLGYGDATTVSVLGAGGADAGAGIITWRPGVGATVKRGEPVYSVNAEPVVLMYGSMPFFRSLTVGDSGPDVEQLENNLSKLGYDGFTVDDEYTSATADAVARWQEDLGLVETGVFDPARAVVAADAIRIAELLAPLGGSASGDVLSYTGTDRQISVELEVADQQLVAKDMPVTVTLPDGSTVDATVTSIGTVVTGGGDESQPGAGQQEEPTTIEVIVTVDDTDALTQWDVAPVDVTIETDRREDVLAVPVGALVALAEGGYGVQVVEGTETRYVATETGMFAEGMVEIDGDGLAAGVVVGVPSS